MSRTLPPELKPELNHLKREIESLKKSVRESNRTATPLPTWLFTIFQGVTLAMVIAGAFWLGSLSKTVSRTELMVDVLRDSKEETNVSLKSIDTRLTVSLKAIETIETRLSNIEKKLDEAITRKR